MPSFLIKRLLISFLFILSSACYGIVPTDNPRVEVETNRTIPEEELGDRSIAASLVIGIGDRLVIQECKYGPFLLSTMDTFIEKSMITYGEWSDASLQVARSFIKSGDVVVDVGASIGALTIPLAKLVGSEGSVLAFEPQRILSQQLAANAVLNHVSNIEIINAAVGNHEEKLIEVPKVNYSMKGDFGSVSLLNNWKSAGALVELVPFLKLDNVLIVEGTKCPSFMKIDAAGMELDVLKGGEKLINACRPVLQIRSDCNTLSRDTIPLLSGQAFNYTCHWEVHERFHVNNFAKEVKSIYDEKDKYSIDLLCFDSERISISSNLTVSVEITGEEYILENVDFPGIGSVTQQSC